MCERGPGQCRAPSALGSTMVALQTTGQCSLVWGPEKKGMVRRLRKSTNIEVVGKLEEMFMS